MIRFALALLLAAAALAAGAHTQDLEREDRWRAEVVPGLVVGEAVDIPGPSGRPFLGLLTEAAGVDRAATTLLVIVHGIGVHPDHGIIGKLRMDLADKGYSTLSIQMPVLPADAPAEHYEPVFGNAAARIDDAAAWARQKGYNDLVLVSHSLGSRMANAYFDRTASPGFRAWIALGLGAPYSAKFSRKPPVPVFDIYGERDLPAVLKHSASRGRVAGASHGQQRKIGGADHFYAGREAALVDVVATFAKR